MSSRAGLAGAAAEDNLQLRRARFQWRLLAAFAAVLLLCAALAHYWHPLPALLVGILLGALAVWQCCAPLNDLARAAERAAEGDEPPELHIRRHDEIGQLAESLRRLMHDSRQRINVIGEERNRLLAILGGMVEGVIAVDKDERVVHMNRVAGQIFNVDAQQCIGKRIWEAVRVSDVLETFSSTLKHGRETTGELRLPSQELDIQVEMYASPLNDEGGARSGVVMVLHNVTQLRRLEGIRRDFVANVSHELKTPLTAVRGFVETMVDDPQMEPETRQRFLRRMSEQTQRLSAIVNDLLTVSRIESGGAALDRERLDLRIVAQECLRVLQPAADAKGIALQAQLPEQSVQIDGDREALRQALSNLLDNAIKYTPEGGQVWLRVLSEDRAVVEVEDTGIGISAQDQQRIFERFFRVDKARSRELGGTGLGLSIVKHLTLAHGGRVSLDSTLGKGSLFRIELPLAED
jgi:two-component system phosphate regulon sensor histidine kinase PhoR